MSADRSLADAYKAFAALIANNRDVLSGTGFADDPDKGVERFICWSNQVPDGECWVEVERRIGFVVWERPLTAKGNPNGR